MQNLRLDRHFIANCHADSTLWHDSERVIHVRSQRCLQTNITRCPLCCRMSCLYLSHMRYQLSFITMYPCKQTNNIGPTYWNRATVGIPCSYMQCTSTQQDSAWIEHASWLSLIPFWLVTYDTIFSTSHFFSWSSSSCFYNSKPWLQKHFPQVRLEPNRAQRQALQAMLHSTRYSSSADTSQSTATLKL